MAEFVKVTFIVGTVAVLQALLSSASQLTTNRQDSANHSSWNNVIDILSPDMHPNDMQQVNVCVVVVVVVVVDV